MLTELRLRNFKRFGDETTRIPLAPLTLVLGANSTGKSSIFQALLALKQSWEPGIDGFMSLRTEGPWASLGRFGNVVHRHQDVPLEIGLSWEGGSADFTWEGAAFGADNLATRGEATGVALRGKSGEATRHLTPVDRFEDGRMLLRFEPKSWNDAFRDEPREVSGIRRCLRAEPVPAHWTMLLDPAEHTVGYGLAPSRPVPPPDVLSEDQRQSWRLRYQDHAAALSALDLKPDSQFTLLVREEVDARLAAARRKLETIRHVGPTRLPGRRIYALDGLLSDHVGAGGDRLADVLLQVGDRLQEVNSYLQQIGVPYALGVRELPALGPAVELLLIERPRGETWDLLVGVQDVGFGVSQILPILTSWAGMRAQENAKRSDILLVEQPELHLHPRWQVALLRLLADPLRRDRRSDDAFDQVVLETHSEAMVRAAQQLVRRELIRPEDVCILSFELSEVDGTTDVQRIELDSRGRFMRRWPKGFFTELEELEIDGWASP